MLFDNAVYQAKLAGRTSNIAGILWHQGEADCGESMYPLYENKMQKLNDAFYKALGLENVPFLLGALGDYLPECPFDPNLVNYKEINKALMNLSEKNKFVGYVKANNLSSKSDFLHFNTESLMEFGHRFYCEFEKLEDKAKVFEEKSLMDDAFRTEMEKL